MSLFSVLFLIKTCTWKCVINFTRGEFTFSGRDSRRACLKKCLECVYFWWLPFSALSITSDNPSQVSRVVVAVETLDLNDNAPELDRQYNTAMCDSASTGQVREQATCYYGRKEGHTCLHWLVHLLLHQNVKHRKCSNESPFVKLCN